MSKFDTHGSVFAPKGYMRVNAGGSHEENPNGGVQVGMDEQGVPNVLEEGEPVYNDYVYSDNIVADADILKKANIPAKYAGKLYSVIADTLVDEAAEMPLDPIANKGLNAMLVRLADAQEEQKAIEQQKELEKELAGLSPEELAELEQRLAEQEAAQVQQEQQMMQPQEQIPVDAMQMQPSMEQQTMLQQPMMACGGKMHKYDGGGRRYRSVQWPYGNAWNQFDAPLNDGTDEPITPILQLYELPVRTGPTYPDYAAVRETDYQVPNSAVDTVRWKYGPFYNNGVPVSSTALRTAPAATPVTATVPATPATTTTTTVAGAARRRPAIPVVPAVTPDTVRVLESDDIGIGVPLAAQQVVEDRLAKEPERILARPTTTPAIDRVDALRSIAANQPVPEPVVVEERDERALPTWPRYAGAITSGILGMYNAFQEPDKYNIPRYQPVLPYGRMHLVDPVYNPLDQNQVTNDLLANSAGATRGLMYSTPNPAVPATLLAQDYNTGRNMGTAATTVWDANNQRRNAVIAAHNQNASTLGNFHYGQNRERAHILNDAERINLQNELYRQRLNYEAEAQKYAAIQNQIDAVNQALAGIGRENFAMNQLNSNTAFNYGVGRNGWGYYQGLPYYAACGGKMKKK